MTLADAPAVLTVEETGQLLRIGRSAAYAAVKAGEIPSIKVGRSIRVPRHRLEAMLGAPENESARGGQPASAEDERRPAHASG
jgi:excisionase family DNA binding protein